jgi:tetratricopeptide (TPR) repeat protein
LDAFHEVVRLKPDFTEAYDELASIYDDLSQLDKAVFYYEKSPELKPDC